MRGNGRVEDDGVSINPHQPFHPFLFRLGQFFRDQRHEESGFVPEAAAVVLTPDFGRVAPAVGVADVGLEGSFVEVVVAVEHGDFGDFVGVCGCV